MKLFTTKELRRLPDPTWLLDKWIPEGGVVGLYGPPNEGKSFIALDWAMCISEGMPWLKRYKTKQAPAVYVAAEGGRGIKKRVEQWMIHHDVKDLPAMYWLLDPLNVREPGVIEEFIEELHSGPDYNHLNPGLIVLDTLNRSFSGGDENSSKDMGEFINNVVDLAKLKNMTALVVHHTNATGTRERGHGSLRGGAEAMIKCTAEKNTDEKIYRVTLVNDKQKDEASAGKVYLAPQENTTRSLVFVETEAPERKERGTGVPGPMRKVDMVTLLGSQEDGYSWTEWKAAAGIDKDRFNKRVRHLMREGEIFKEGGRYYVVPANIDLAIEDEEEDSGLR